jgi:hypothetical protein
MEPAIRHLEALSPSRARPAGRPPDLMAVDVPHLL